MTIKDIAKLANVSVSTVSKILNNKDDDISEKTRKKVLDIVKKYQYTPYSKIKQQSSARSFLLALIIPREYEYAKALVSSVEKASADKGYSLVVYFTDTIEEEEKYFHIIAGKNIDAILMYSFGEAKEILDIYNNEKTPLILLNNIGEYKNVAQIFTNFNNAGYLATNHMIEQGHKSIGILLKNGLNSENILDGYSRALFENDILYDNSKVYIGEDNLESGNIGAHQFINMNITAVVCENEKIACGVYQTCNKYGIKIPKDISIISLNGTELSEILIPGLDIVDLNIHDIGIYAISAVENIIVKKASPNSCYKEIDLFVTVRESVSHPDDKTYGRGDKIVVVGSMNMDTTINVEKLPSDGETLISSKLSLLLGGKGANQAIGAGRLGGNVYMIGCLGNDGDGKKIYQNLSKNAVKLDGVYFDNVLPTGKAYISVSKGGESTVVVYPGANNNLDTYKLRKFKKLFKDAEYCLLSLEIPKRAWSYALNLCKETETKVLVKPATIKMMDDSELKNIDYLIPNEKEINQLVEGRLSIPEKANVIYKKGVENVIVTLGSKGCYLKNKDYSTYFDAAPFEPIDTTGASDAFISALAVSLSEGNDLITAIKIATYAAGISITRLGAQPSMPDIMTLNIYKDEIMEMKTHNHFI